MNIAIAGILAFLIVLTLSAGLIVLGVLGARREGPVRALGIAAIVAGVLLPLVLVLSLLLQTTFTTFLTAVLVLAGFLGLAVWVTALADCIQREPDDRNNRLIWVIVIVFGQLIGALLYWLWWRPRRKTEAKV